MFTILLFFTIVLASYCLGCGYLRLIKFDEDSGLKHVFALPMGWGILAYLGMGLAALGILSKGYMTVLLVSCILLGFAEWKNIILSILSIPSLARVQWKRMSRIEKCLWGILIWIFVWSLLDVLAPPTAADSLTYHFRIAYDYVKEGKIVYNTFIHYSFPHLAEMFSLYSFVFMDEIASQAQYYFFTIMLACLLISFGIRYYDRLTGLLATVLFFSLPIITYIKSSGNVDIALTMVLFASLWALLEGFRSTKKDSTAWFILTGSLLGIACGVKYYGLISALIITILFCCLLFIRGFNWNKFRLFCSYGLALFFFACPFYIKNFIFVGNPIYPALYNIFGGIDWSVERGRLFEVMSQASKMPLGHSLMALVMSPWNITMHGVLIGGYGTEYGPIYIASLPLLICGVHTILGNSQKKQIILFLLFCCLFWTFWFFMAFQRGRHLLIVFMLLTLILSAGIVAIFRKGDDRYKWWKIGILFVLLICTGFNMAIHGVFNGQFVKVVLGFESIDQFLKRKLPYYIDVKWINENLPKDAKVLNYIVNHSYYLKRDMVYPSLYFQGHYDFLQYTSVEQYYFQLKNEGFTHVLTQYDENNMNINTGDHLRDEYEAKYFRFHNALIEKYGREIYRRKAKAYYRRTFSDKTKQISVKIYELR